MKEPLSYTKEQIKKAKYDKKKNVSNGENIKTLGAFISSMSTSSLDFFLLADNSELESLEWIVATAYHTYAEELGVDVNIIPMDDLELKQALVKIFCDAVLIEKLKRNGDMEIGAEDIKYLDMVHLIIQELSETE